MNDKENSINENKSYEMKIFREVKFGKQEKPRENLKKIRFCPQQIQLCQNRD